MSVWNLVSKEYVVSLHFFTNVPSTSEVSSVTWAAFRLPAGSDKPIFSSLSRKLLPPFLDFALIAKSNVLVNTFAMFGLKSKLFVLMKLTFALSKA